MLIHIYNKSFEKIGIVDNDLSLIWNRKYNRPDTFQITTNINQKVLDLFEDGNFIRKDGDSTLAYITYTEKDNQNLDNSFIVKGLGFCNKLEGRYNEEYYYKTDTTINHIKNLVDNNVINPKNVKRRYPNFRLVIDVSVKEVSEVPYKCEYGTDILTVISELCDIDNLGYSVELIDNIAHLIIYKGENKTFEQDFNSPVLFSAERDNILGQRFVKESSNKKNVLLVIGQGEDDDKFVVEVGEEEQEGYDRFEGTINAQDIDPENDGDYLSAEEYKELLKQRGKKAVKDFKELISYDNEIHSESNLVYKKDFNLGDLVEMENKDWGVKLQTRILEVEEVYEGSLKVSITVGDELPTISSKLQQIEQAQNTPLPIKSKSIESVPGGKGDPGQDGKEGLPGKDGIGINYTWQDTRLGIKRENESVFTFVNLKGEKGDTGAKGADGKPGINGINGKQGIQGEKGNPGIQGLPGKDGTDANITKDKVLSVLGYIPVQTLDLRHIETSIANLEHSKASKEELQDVSEAISRNIPNKISQLTNDRNFLNDMLSYAKVKDTRNRIDLPSDFQSGEGQKAHFEFKNIASVDNPPVQAHRTYVYVLTFAGWRDASGGYPVQLAFGENGLATRIGISQDTWSSWEKVADIKDIPSTIAWNNISNKPTSFNPSSHNHDNYALKTALEEVERRLNNLDIPEGVDLTPVYEEINNIKNTNHFESKSVGSKSFDYMKEPGIFRIYHTTTSPNRTNQDYILYVSKYNSNILQIAFLLEANREDLGKMYVRTFTGGQFSSWTNINDKPAETIVIEDSGIKYKAKYVMKNNIPHLEILERL